MYQLREISRLDLERAHSMADEGGTSAAILEGENTRYLTRPKSSFEFNFLLKFKENSRFWIPGILLATGLGIALYKNRQVRA